MDYLEQHRNEVKWDYPGMVAKLNVTSISDLNNGLSEEENLVLFETLHIPVIVSLILKGLAARESRSHQGCLR